MAREIPLPQVQPTGTFGGGGGGGYGTNSGTQYSLARTVVPVSSGAHRPRMVAAAVVEPVDKARVAVAVADSMVAVTAVPQDIFPVREALVRRAFLCYHLRSVDKRFISFSNSFSIHRRQVLENFTLRGSCTFS